MGHVNYRIVANQMQREPARASQKRASARLPKLIINLITFPSSGCLFLPDLDQPILEQSNTPCVTNQNGTNELCSRGVCLHHTAALVLTMLSTAGHVMDPRRHNVLQHDGHKTTGMRTCGVNSGAPSLIPLPHPHSLWCVSLDHTSSL